MKTFYAVALAAITILLISCGSGGNTMSYNGTKSNIAEATVRISKHSESIDFALNSQDVTYARNYHTGEPVEIPASITKISINPKYFGKKVDLKKLKYGDDKLEVTAGFGQDYPVDGHVSSSFANAGFEKIKSGTLLVKKNSDTNYTITLEAKAEDGKSVYVHYSGEFKLRD